VFEAARARRFEQLCEIGDAGEDRGALREMQIGRLRQKPRDRGLAGSRRARSSGARRGGREGVDERDGGLGGGGGDVAARVVRVGVSCVFFFFHAKTAYAMAT